MAVTKKCSVYKLTAALDAITDPGSLLVRGIKWVGPTTIGHQVTITCTDSAGTGAFWSGVCATANDGDEVWFPVRPFEVKGLAVSVLTSGYVLVYVE